MNNNSKEKKYTLVILLLMSFGYSACIYASAVENNSNKELTKKTLVIGKVSDNPKKHYRYLKPMVDYIVENMKDLGIEEGKVLMARDNRQMISYLKQGKVDWVTETPFSAVIFQEKANAKIILRKWKKGVAKYHTVFFARKESKIDSLTDLKGKVIAFEDPGSSTAFYIPAAELIDHGLSLTKLSSVRESAPNNQVGYVFSGEEINTSVWVYKNLVSAGVFNNIDWQRDDQLPKKFRAEFKIFHKTKSFPRATELVSSHLEDIYVNRLKSLLLNAHNDPGAAKALWSYQRTKKFDAFDAKGLEALEEAKRIGKIVNRELN